MTGNLSLFALPLFLILWKEGPPQTCSPYSSRHRGICRKLLDLIESWGALFCPMFPCELLKVTMQQDPHVLSSSAFSHLCSSSTLKPNLCTELLNLLGQLEMCKKKKLQSPCLLVLPKDPSPKHMTLLSLKTVMKKSKESTPRMFVIVQPSIIDTSHKISRSLRSSVPTLTSISFLSDPFSGRARSQFSVLYGKIHSNLYERSPVDFIPYI